MNKEINRIFMMLSKRAEKLDHTALIGSFVEIGPLVSVLSTTDNQILYGRRGTGKTHVLVYLAENKRLTGDIPVYVDLRQIGSTGGIYSDPTATFPERATRLLIDTLGAVHEELVTYLIKNEDEINAQQIYPILDLLAKAITEVAVKGPVEQEISGSDSSRKKVGESISCTLTPEKASFSASSATAFETQEQESYRLKSSGSQIYRINFGSVATVLAKLTEALNGKRIWIFLDEWSVIPLDLQPYLADFLRRSLFPVPRITVKIGAIEKRSCFRTILEGGDYIGIELGGDASADVNMDDYCVFDNSEQRAMSFFRTMIFRHFRSVQHPNEILSTMSEDTLIRLAFTQDNVFILITTRIPYSVFSNLIRSMNPAALGQLPEQEFVSGFKVAALVFAIINTSAIIPSFLRGPEKARLVETDGEQRD